MCFPGRTLATPHVVSGSHVVDLKNLGYLGCMLIVFGTNLLIFYAPVAHAIETSTERGRCIIIPPPRTSAHTGVTTSRRNVASNMAIGGPHAMKYYAQLGRQHHRLSMVTIPYE